METSSNRFVLRGLSNEDLLAATRALVGRSNDVTADLISHLAEVDERKLYLEQARPSLFAWCVAELGCSEDVACNWITVARCSRKYPAVLDVLRQGKVHLTGLRILAPHLTDDGHRALLDEAARKSKREIEELVARIAPRPAVPASIRKLPVAKVGRAENGRGAVRLALLAGDSGQADAAESTTPPPAAPGEAGEVNCRPADGLVGASLQIGKFAPNARTAPCDATPRLPHGAQARGKVEPLSGEAYKVTFTASRRLRDKIRQAQDLLAHQVRDGNLPNIVERGLDLLIEDVKKRRFAVGRKPRAGKPRRQAEQRSAPAREDPSPRGADLGSTESVATTAADTPRSTTDTVAGCLERRLGAGRPSHVRETVGFWCCFTPAAACLPCRKAGC